MYKSAYKISEDKTYMYTILRPAVVDLIQSNFRCLVTYKYIFNRSQMLTVMFFVYQIAQINHMQQVYSDSQVPFKL